MSVFMRNRSQNGAALMWRGLLALAVSALATLEMARAEAPLPTPTPAGTVELPSELAKAMDDYDQATFRNDTAAYRNLVADEYILVNSDASMEDKEQSLLPFSQPGFRIDPYVNEQPLQIVWDDGAVLGGLLRLSWTQDGRPQTRLVRTAHVWAKRDGHWRLMYTQVTRVPE